MKKLTLNLDDLQVESFETASAEAERGTVRAHDHCSCECQTLPGETCPGRETCVYSCYGSRCWDTCHLDWTCGETCWYQSCAGTCFEYTCNEWTCFEWECGNQSGDPWLQCPIEPMK
ncbi:MAG TPA: pinensin family lanthipeptide [Longimicrobium sp.]|nr:pinensin family lanthipeptide [Longimicrobium sp.]